MEEASRRGAAGAMPACVSSKKRSLMAIGQGYNPPVPRSGEYFRSSIRGTSDLTTHHVRGAIDNDRVSLEWIVTRFSPLLMAQARRCLGARFESVIDPGDIVAEVWAICLSRLSDIQARDGRVTPVLLRFLSTTLVHRVNKLLEREMRRRANRIGPVPSGEESDGSMAELKDETTSILTRIMRSEEYHLVLTALDQLAPRDREIVLLRGVEQRPNQEVAMLLDLSPSNVALRYHRALARLRTQLPRSVFDELPGGDEAS